MIGINDIRHPFYDQRVLEWIKWRSCYVGGRDFLERYLQRFTKREETADFELRKSMSYVPAFAKAAINEIKNSIYQRMSAIVRTNGSDTYQRAIKGLDDGVDLTGNSMNCFIGQQILPELLVMSRVGIYVDMPRVQDYNTLADFRSKPRRPYIYMYETEAIQSWAFDETAAPGEFKAILLRDFVNTIDEKTGLINGQTSRYRYIYIEEGIVFVQFHNQFVDPQTDELTYIPDEGGPIPLGINRIPFIMLELPDSLLADIANYQIALLNLASSDMAYALKSNYPFYTEQFDMRASSPYLRTAGQDFVGEKNDADTAKTQEITVGMAQGRRYPIGADRPQFIHPSPEPLKVSMEKQTQLKDEIRQLVMLAVSNLATTQTTAESKGMDDRGLEAGLSAIGLQLESAERQVSKFWAMYEKNTAATVNYPEKYQILSDDDRRKDASEDRLMMDAIPSITFKRHMAKKIVATLLEEKISYEDIKKINSEIDSAQTLNSDAAAIVADVAAGLVDAATASLARGYPAGSAEKAKTDHSDRLARIAEVQTAGKAAIGGAGTPPAVDPVPDKTTTQEEKVLSQNPVQNPDPEPKVRGKAK